MQYHDEIYGTEEIAEPVLLELMESEAMRRLKEVAQHGVTALLGITPPFSRFDHSVGTMILVRRLGAPLGEQVAALLHDVSHTAFSHVIDFVFHDHNGQSYHEAKQEEFIAASDIPALLDRHGLDWRVLLDEARFPLLEQPLPALCADRLDYFFRDLKFLRLACDDEIRHALSSLVVREGSIAMGEVDAARWLAYTFIEADRASWSNFREVGLYQITADAIRAAAGSGCIGEADFWGSDANLWEKLCASEHAEVKRLVNLISPGTRFTWDEDRPAFRVTAKVRSIDPPVVQRDSVIPLSALDPGFARFRNEYLAGKRGAWPMGVVHPSAAVS